MSGFPKPSFTVDAVVLAGKGEDMSLLLIERGRPPFAGVLALPGGFVDEGEYPLNAAVRELVEETGLDAGNLRPIPLSLRSKKGRDPRGWTISQPYLFYLNALVPVRGGDDARRADWLPLSRVTRLAFDHGAMLCEALARFWPDMPHSELEFTGIPAPGIPESLPRRVTFFGGSFNPWHRAHTACVRACPNREGLVVVPDYNPQKNAPENGCSWERFQEIRKLTHGQVLGVYPGFCGIEFPNPTVYWLPGLEIPQKGMLIGADSFAGFARWREAEKLARDLDHLFVMPRRESPVEIEKASAWFASINPECGVEYLGDHPFRGLSSTELRKSKK